MQNLRNSHTKLIRNHGFGYCAYGSKLLGEQLLVEEIPFNYIRVEYLKNNKLGNYCRENVNQVIEKLPLTGNSIQSQIRKSYHARGDKLPTRTGHGVILSDNYIYDITSKQFGLDEKYTLDLLLSTWKHVDIVEDFPIDRDADFLISTNLKKIKRIKKRSIIKH